MIRKLPVLLLAAAGLLSARSLETIPFRAVLSPANETPPISGLAASGIGTVWLHVVRDNSGKVVSAITDFDSDVKFPGDVTITGMHIHKGAAGLPGPVTIDSGIRAANPVNFATGVGNLKRQGITQTSDTAGLDTVNGMLADPSGFYLNVHTTVNPAGAIRGQLQRANMVVLLGLMSPKNETPPITDSAASAIGTIVALMTTDTNGAATSGRVIFDAKYTGFTEGVDITGFHIHKGAAGLPGSVTINTGLNGTNSVAVPASGAGNLHYEVEVDMTSAAAVDTLQGLFSHPQDYYENIHTRTFPGGLVRAQLRNTDKMSFPLEMSSANEVPPLATPQGTGTGTLTVYTLRDSSGAVVAGTTIFDVATAFDGAATVTGMHIHNAPSTDSGIVTVNTGLSATNSVTFDSGVGSLYKIVTVSDTAGLATLNSLVMNPENHYVNVHTTVNGGGAIRAQVAAANTKLPSVTAAISAISVPTRTIGAPGGMMTIFGSNLVKVPTSPGAAADGSALPLTLNGTTVTIGGKKAPLIMLDPGFVVVQVPTDTPSGDQAIVVTNSNGASASFNTSIAPVAPGIFFDSNGGIALKNNDFSLVGTGNAAKANDILLIYSTGLGATTPALTTGQVTPAPGANNTLYKTANTTATIGGKPAQVIYSIASPGFVGLYQTAVVVPSGAGTGKVPVVLTTSGVDSNSVNIELQ